MKLIENACRAWLPEFGQDNECCEGRVIDIDTYMEYGFSDVNYPPCPFCNAEDFEARVAELLALGGDDADAAEDLLRSAAKARCRMPGQRSMGRDPT